MTKRRSVIHIFYDRVVLRHPLIIILCVLAAVCSLAFHISGFTLDASPQTLLLDNDKDLQYSRLISSRYGKKNFLVLAYTHRGDLFSENALAALARLRDDLTALESISSVTSILDVPLLESPALKIKELTRELPTLNSPTVDRDMARTELSQSPLYRDLLLSSDLKTTALMLNFPRDDVYYNLLARRDELKQKKSSGSLSPPEQAEFKRVVQQFQQHRSDARDRRHQDILEIRTIMDKYRSDADMFLGGVSMIVDDMITFIRNELKVFGIGVMLFLIIMLGIIFRSIRWIFLSMLCCLVSTIVMIGLLGWFGWEVTVISSNFISLQLIMTLAIAIHLIVRYRELLLQSPQASNHQLILDTICLKLKPCVYAALTTIAGFGSLLFSGILPVRTFGWMMIVGLIVSLVVTFLLFPACLMLMPKEMQNSIQRHRGGAITVALAKFTEANGTLIIAVSCVLLIASIFGISRLTVENCFIDYFKKTTEIYQGMKVVDQRLGGTTALDIIVDFENPDIPPSAAEPVATESDDIFGEFDEFDEAATDEKYWFTSEKMNRIKTTHRYLDQLAETGKVLSLASLLSTAASTQRIIISGCLRTTRS